MALREDNRWAARPRLALALRILTILVPFGLSFASSLLAHRWLGAKMPGVSWIIPTALSLITASAVLIVAERAMRRVLPLVMLLKLALLFPDQVPSRLGVALRAASPKRLHRSVSSGDPVEAAAAENILALVAALSAHDRATRGHSERVRAVTMLVADQMKITGPDRDKLEWAALLHDLGKLSVAPAILNTNGPPTDEEWHELRRHPAEGAPLARCLEDWLGDWVHAIDQHHERFDGTGYPHGLRDGEITLSGRIVAVSDAFEVMTAVRSYKRAMSTTAAREELVRCAGTHFDPAVVRSFMGVSLAKLHRALGPSSWLASLPFQGLVGEAARASGALVGGVAPPVLAATAAAVLLSVGAIGTVGTGTFGPGDAQPVELAATLPLNTAPAASRPMNAGLEPGSGSEAAQPTASVDPVPSGGSWLATPTTPAEAAPVADRPAAVTGGPVVEPVDQSGPDSPSPTVVASPSADDRDGTAPGDGPATTVPDTALGPADIVAPVVGGLAEPVVGAVVVPIVDAVVSPVIQDVASPVAEQLGVPSVEPVLDDVVPPVVDRVVAPAIAEVVTAVPLPAGVPMPGQEPTPPPLPAPAAPLPPLPIDVGLPS